MYFKVLSKITPDKLIGKKTQCWQIVRRPCTSMSFVAGKISCLRLPFPQTSICIVREYTHGDISMCIVYISVYCISVYVFCVDIHTYITKENTDPHRRTHTHTRTGWLKEGQQQNMHHVHTTSPAKDYLNLRPYDLLVWTTISF